MNSPISREEAQVTAVHGSLVKTLRLMVGATIPEEARPAFLQGLPADSRALLDPDADIPEWIPIPFVLEGFQALEARLHHSPRVLFGRLLAEFDGGQRLFQEAIQDQDPVAAIHLLPKAWSLFNRGGCITVTHAGPRDATLWNWAWDPYSDIRREMVAGFLLEGLGATGAPNPRVEVFPAQGDAYGDRYEVRWG